MMAHAGAPLAGLSKKSHILTCGAENAVAATKSVVEQALFYQAVFAKLNKAPLAAACRGRPFPGKGLAVDEDDEKAPAGRRGSGELPGLHAWVAQILGDGIRPRPGPIRGRLTEPPGPAGRRKGRV